MRKETEPPVNCQEQEGRLNSKMALNIHKDFVPSPLEIQRMMAQVIFECQKCGWCCIHCDPVTVSSQDVILLSKYMNKPLKTVVRKHLRTHEITKKLSIKKTKPCKFYDIDNKKCNIYPARPLVCRAWPFFSTFDEEKERFAVTVPGECPGAVKAYLILNLIQNEFERHLELVERCKDGQGAQAAIQSLIRATSIKLRDGVV